MHDTVRAFLKDNSTPSCVLFTICYLEYGSDFLDWDPYQLRMELHEDYGVELSSTQSNKLQSAIIIASSDRFEDDWHVFNCCIHGLNGEHFDYDVLDPVDAEQIAAGMPEVEILRTNFQENDLKYDSEVNAYAGLIFSEYGLFFAPPVFTSAIMPSLPGTHESSSQEEKIEALNSIYNLKRSKIVDYFSSLHHCFEV